MTEITWKNGGPLFLNENGAPGVVAASSGCCCPPPPPERCWCPDWCLYQVEITSPVAFPPLPVAPCQWNSPFNEENYLRREVLESGLYGPCEDEDQCCGPVTSPIYDGWTGLQNHYAEAYVSLPSLAEFQYHSNLAAGASASVSFRCENNDPAIVYADIALQFSVPAWDGLIPRSPSRALSKFVTVELDTTCAMQAGATCDPLIQDEPLRYSLLNVPLEFTVSHSSAGLAAWDEDRTVDGINGLQTRVTPCFDHLVDNFEVTFRITARESCVDVPKCCCEAEGVTVVDPYEACDGTTSAIQDPPIDLEDITIVVDWDGLTLTLTSPFFSDSGSEAVDFSCQKEGDDPFDATERSLSANFFPYAGECVWFTSNITAFFGGPSLAQSNTISPYVGECKLNAPAGEGDTSCDFGDYLSWCSDHPYANSVTVEMIIAP